MKLTKQQTQEIWGEDGPYSQVQMIVETRILDDSVSRVFVNVDAQINPLTYKIIKQNVDNFKDDEKILQLFDHAQFHGKSYGYVATAFSEELTGPDVLKRAQFAADRAKDVIIKMHKFVMELFDIKSNKMDHTKSAPRQ